MYYARKLESDKNWKTEELVSILPAMSPAADYSRQGYASFQLRFRALLLDFGICLAFFMIGGLSAGALLEEHPFARASTLVLIIGSILLYDPFMVSQYGGTFGHRVFNVRVVQAETRQNLPFVVALVRSIIKGFLGVFSLVFMFVTKRAQGLHDLAVGSEVRIRNPRSADATDYFVPLEMPADVVLPSAMRRIIVIALY